MSLRYVFGPVPSRRFSSSLGVNPVPRKTCNYSCIYCQLGRTDRLWTEPAVFHPTEDVIADIAGAIDDYGEGIDYITFMGDGEPTLASNLGEMVSAIKDIWKGRTALITNGSLLHLTDVRKAALMFDVVSPTVSAGDERTFRRLHRPARSLTLELVMRGMKMFRDEFDGEIWAEVMLVAGVNDSEVSLRKIRDTLKDVGADRTFISAPIRPPADLHAAVPSKEIINRALKIIPGAEDMTTPENGPFIVHDHELIASLIDIATNHPLREDQALGILSEGVGKVLAKEMLNHMVDTGVLERTCHSGTVFLRAPADLRSGHPSERRCPTPCWPGERDG